VSGIFPSASRYKKLAVDKKIPFVVIVLAGVVLISLVS
jgi:hypothetical protein